MLLQLTARPLRPLAEHSRTPFIGRIRELHGNPVPAATEILLSRESQLELPAGFRGYLLEQSLEPGRHRDVFALPPDLHYLAEGDIVRIDPEQRSVRVLYRKSSPSNSFLVTERCDNYCVMCSQPPKKADDSWLVEELLQLLPLVSAETREIGITGGEPGLLRERLVELVRVMKSTLPNTAVHILSNGRQFADRAFAAALGAVEHPDLMVGVPIYSDLSHEHDYIVQDRSRSTTKRDDCVKRSGTFVAGLGIRPRAAEVRPLSGGWRFEGRSATS